jgi:5'-AMP-activated protein kinase regulatory beta subunit
MLKKSSAKTKKRKITFTLIAPDAEEVFLVGDFNNWNEKKQPMKKDESGRWKKDIIVAPGRYEYKYLVDGQWKIDQANNEVIQNRFGTLNNVILVKSK